MPMIDTSAIAAFEEFSAEALGLTKAMEAVTAPMREAMSSVAFDELERVRTQAAQAVTALGAAMPMIDTSAIAAFEGFSAEALGLTKAMEAVTAPMREAMSSVAFDELERVRTQAAQAVTALGAAMPMIDTSAIAAFEGFPAEALSTILGSEDLKGGRALMDSLDQLSVAEWSVKEMVATQDSWSRFETALDSFDTDVQGLDPSSAPQVVAALVALATLLAVEVGSSEVLLDAALFTVNAVLGLVSMVWQLATLNGVSAPMGTLGGLAGIISLILLLRDGGRGD